MVADRPRESDRSPSHLRRRLAAAARTPSLFGSSSVSFGDGPTTHTSQPAQTPICKVSDREISRRVPLEPMNPRRQDAIVQLQPAFLCSGPRRAVAAW